MKKALLIIVLIAQAMGMLAQEETESVALQKAREAVALMDEGNYEQSIQILEECRKLDPKNYLYPYEIGLANVYMKNYEEAINVLKKTLKLPGSNSQVYQLLGNTYSLSGQRDKAIKTYKKGLSKFQDAGNLYLEIGNIHLHEEDYERAIENYEQGIAIDPMYPSNYFRLAKLYLNSSNKVPGLIYGEIFMNIERTSSRTQEMSELLYRAYESSITISGDSTDLDFCQIVIVGEVESFNDMEELELPYCAIFGKNILLATIGQKEVTPQSLAEIRAAFIDLYYQEDAEKYPVVLYDYHREMIKAGVFEAYNHYLFQIGHPDHFENWLSTHQVEFDNFTEWYTSEMNVLMIDKENRYLRFK